MSGRRNGSNERRCPGRKDKGTGWNGLWFTGTMSERMGLGNGRLSLVPVGRGVAFSHLAWLSLDLVNC